jgi:hypothetical protein
MHIIITCNSACVKLGTPSQAPEFRKARPSSDRGKSVKASINSPSTEEVVYVISLLRAWRQGGLICVSTRNMPAAQIYLQSAIQLQKDNVYMCLEPYRLGEEYVFVLKNGAVANSKFSSYKKK